ncbi:LysR family transcriptional regulator [Kordiimonas sp. SCSIO 12610]|uniref:LysR family transcriptional regulator n=1 Tax=Kordiimonas sp. SCSIO 12610 TaxID=2829597 RepID=UPI00210BA3C6|nr:LysR family transcriptional regulator [Kordiimonas sp. SCSIO 12610]UTW55546.1 LysR family transcriptional regulator [Kordiimonas sp. SCSIO 12610]
MDLNAIKTFCRTIEAGNMTAAAKALHITKSVASRRLQALEEDLGVRLLQRATRGVSPTDEGALFYERCQRILDDLDDAQQAVKHASDNLVGHIRVTAPRSFADLHLRKAFIAFMKLHPAVTLELNLTDERVDIVSGGYDLGFRITSNLDDSALIAKKVAPMRFHTVASPDYLKEYGTPQTPDDLRHHKCLFYANVSANQQWRFLDGSQMKSVRVTGPMMSNSGTLQLEAAINGLGVATLPHFFLHDALEDGQLVTILDDYIKNESALYALYPEKRHLPLKVRTLIDFITSWFTQPQHQKCL